MIIYISEKEVSGIFDALQINVDDPGLKEGIAHEAEENKTCCQRLEGIIVLFDRSAFNNLTDERRTNNFVKDVAITMKRILRKHAGFGYHTAIQVAIALGQNEDRNFTLGQCAACGANLGSLKVIDAKTLPSALNVRPWEEHYSAIISMLFRNESLAIERCL